MRLQCYGLSNQGHVRPSNGDSFAELLSHGFFVLADGIGSLKGGQTAARYATQRLIDEIKKNPLFTDPGASPERLGEALDQALVATHRSLWEMSLQQAAAGSMGTTLVCLLINKNTCYFAHAGDSRIYLFRDKQLKLLSRDDSLVFQLLHYGLLAENEARNFPLKHIITKSIGGQSRLAIRSSSAPVESGDLFLLCTDGLTGMLSDDEIRDILLQSSASLTLAAQTLEKAALDKGGLDNITTLLVKAV